MVNDQEEQVYAELSWQRLALPLAGGALTLALAVVIALQTLGTSDGDSTTTDESGAPSEIAAEVVVDDPLADPVSSLEVFVDALGRKSLGSLEFAFGTGDEADADLSALLSEIGDVQVKPVAGTVTTVDAATSTAPFAVEWQLDDGTTFVTEGNIDLRLVGTKWLVDWKPSILESSLDPGDVLVRERVRPARAPILGANDFPLVDNRPVINVGVIPRRSNDIASLSDVLAQTLNLDAAEIRRAIDPSPSDSTVPILTDRPEAIEPARPILAGYPAVVLEESTYPLAVDDRFGRALLGRSAEVTAEILEEHPDLFVVGDVAGRSGLQRQYNAQLTGRPGFQIRVKRRFPQVSPNPEIGGAEQDGVGAGGLNDGLADNPDVIYLEAPEQGRPLRLTIDQRVQRAAENALTRTELPSALVVVQPSTGHILAAANGPGAALSNIAFTGQYPPGSIFKIVTAYASLVKGAGPTESVDCPFDLEVNGRTFVNAEGEKLGTVPLRRAFSQSCNTAFINLANGFLGSSDFGLNGAALGIGGGYDLGTTAFSGSIPNPSGPVEFAATSFGQSRVLMSPLSAAVMAASISSGAYRSPVLVVDDAGAGSDLSDPASTPEAGAAPASTPSAPDAGRPLDPAASASVRDMMRAVVTDGTGKAVAGVGGGPVSGKTGTAEFGSGNPPPAHAWFVGFQGDLAFAVFVEGGEFGGSTAAPIAADFLNRLAG